MQAVRDMRENRVAKANIGETAVGVIEINTAVGEVLKATEAINENQVNVTSRCDLMQTRLSNIETKLDQICDTLLH